MKEEISLTRHTFLKFSTAAAFFFLPVFSLAKKLYAAIQGYITARLNSTYAHDQEMVLRKSQENPEIISLYEDYLSGPNSNTARQLLHTEYTDRSGEIALLKQLKAL